MRKKVNHIGVAVWGQIFTLDCLEIRDRFFCRPSFADLACGGRWRGNGTVRRRAILDGWGWVRETKPSSEQAALFFREAWP